MLLFERKGILKWNSSNRKRYVDLGYKFTEWGNEFLVDINHLTENSRAIVYFSCDYCGKTNLETTFKRYNHNLKRSQTKKDACENCIYLKIKESSMKKYGVDSPNKAKSVKNKKKQIIISKYGYENVSQIPNVRKKIKNTVLTKFGVENVFQSDQVISKMKITRYKNKTVTTSKTQIYINNLLNGELNYPEGRASIDIALIDEKIAIEYDGGGHDLHVKFKEMTSEEFHRKEIKREYFLINKGWKILRIISRKDYIPDDSELIKYIQNAKKYLHNGHSWVKIDIDNSKIYGSVLSLPIKIENLRKIKSAI